MTENSMKKLVKEILEKIIDNPVVVDGHAGSTHGIVQYGLGRVEGRLSCQIHDRRRPTAGLAGIGLSRGGHTLLGDDRARAAGGQRRRHGK